MSKKNKPYPILELHFEDEDYFVSSPKRKIFENIKSNCLAGKSLSEHEKRFLFTGVRISLLSEDGSVEDYPCLDNPNFEYLHLVYINYWKGEGVFHKLNKGIIYIPQSQEVEKDIKYLENKANDWESVVKDRRHSDRLLLETATESNDELDILEALPEYNNDPFAKGKFLFRNAKTGLLLQSKFIYHLSRQIWETFGNQPLVLQLGNFDLEINEYTLIHVLNRHYGQVAKHVDANKSFHKVFLPRVFGLELQDIFERVSSKISVTESMLDRINFRLDGIIYEIWSGVKKKNGQVPYRRLNTFYPLEREQEVNELLSESNEIEIDETLSFFIKR